METQTTSNPSKAVCCPKFDPAVWQEKEITWSDKKFIRGTVRSIFHMPINMGSVITGLCSKVEHAGASLEQDTLMLSDEVSAWKSLQYISVSKDVPNCENITLSGTFLTKVFEGPYRMVPKWYKEMEQYVATKGKSIKKIYVYYTTCPKCAKAQGKNYVVLFAQV
jgi:hypothetical protein